MRCHTDKKDTEKVKGSNGWEKKRRWKCQWHRYEGKEIDRKK